MLSVTTYEHRVSGVLLLLLLLLLLFLLLVLLFLLLLLLMMMMMLPCGGEGRGGVLGFFLLRRCDATKVINS